MKALNEHAKTIKYFCPSCKRRGFKASDVWYPDRPTHTMKCSRCGEWHNLKDWEEETQRMWRAYIEKLKESDATN